MIQDIFPHRFHNEYVERLPEADSVILCFKGPRVLVNMTSGELRYPRLGDFGMASAGNCTYMFSIDDVGFFLADGDKEILSGGFAFENIGIFRSAMPGYNAFAGITAYHLYSWYRGNKYCGRCGGRLSHDHKERMLLCPQCNNRVYPRISPVVIVAVTDGDRILMTKYANREYKKYALVAGFIEIGETAEEAVRREVKEEVGVEVGRITYYKCQPWGFSDSLLFGYFAEINGDTAITMDKDELSEARWIKRNELEVEDDGLSLTNEMIRKFKYST